MKLAQQIAQLLTAREGPRQTMLWFHGDTARCVQGWFEQERGRRVLHTLAPGIRPFWLSEWPEGISAQGSEISFSAWRIGETLPGILSNAASTVLSARGMAEDSAVELSRRLASLEATVRRQTGAVGELAELFSEGRESSLASSLTSLFQSLTELRSTLMTEQDRHHVLVRDAASTVSQLNKLSQTIQTSAMQSRLATFNARLEAARLGEAGLGLTSIASALFELAQSVTAASDGMSRLTMQLGTVLPQLADSSQHVKARLATEMGSLGERVTDLQTQLTRSEQMASTNVDRARRDGEMLVGEMNTAMAELQSTDRLCQLLDAVHRALLMADAGDPGATGQLDERRASLTSGTTDAAPAIELF